MYKFIINFCILICFFQNNCETSPTQRHLELHTLEKITEELTHELQKKIPQFLEIASYEDEDTFFGYHGMSHHCALFQDILRVIFEDILLLNLPTDFYFLRIPGQAKWNWENGKDDFLNYFFRPVSRFHKNLILENFLRIIEEEMGFSLQLDNFSSIEYTALWNFFQNHITYFTTENVVKKYSMPLNYEESIISYNEGLEELIVVITQHIHKINSQVDNQFIQKWFEERFYASPLVIEIFRLEKILNQVEAEDKAKILELCRPFSDTEAPQNEILLSLNTTILGNYRTSGCFTAGIFLSDKSMLGNDSRLHKILKNFFVRIGLKPSLSKKIWRKGQKILKKTNKNQGYLLQFFDESFRKGETKFSLLDKNVYLSFIYGIPVNHLIPSEYIQGNYLLNKNKRDLELRLVINNQTVLNPFSALRIVRYDSSFRPSEVSTEVIKMIKKNLNNQARDEIKIRTYIELLENLWQVSLK